MARPFLRARASQFTTAQDSLSFVAWCGSLGVLVWLKIFLHAAKGQATRYSLFSPFPSFAFLFSFFHYHTGMFF